MSPFATGGIFGFVPLVAKIERSQFVKVTTTGGTPLKLCLLFGREYSMVINFITTPKWMVGEQLTVAEMVDEILVHSSMLDPRRKYMFIEWLQVHCSKLKNVMNVCEDLTAWLESMRYESIQWEYRLILDEINWWRGLDERSLERMMLDHFVRSNL